MRSWVSALRAVGLTMSNMMRIIFATATPCQVQVAPIRSAARAEMAEPRETVMTSHRVAIVAGARTPFVKAGQAFSSLGPLALAKHAVRGLLDRHDVDPARIDAIAFGAVVPQRGKPNLAREIVIEA